MEILRPNKIAIYSNKLIGIFKNELRFIYFHNTYKTLSIDRLSQITIRLHLSEGLYLIKATNHASSSTQTQKFIIKR
jgi:hypothetical protein